MESLEASAEVGFVIILFLNLRGVKVGDRLTIFLCSSSPSFSSGRDPAHVAVPETMRAASLGFRTGGNAGIRRTFLFIRAFASGARGHRSGFNGLGIVRGFGRRSARCMGTSLAFTASGLLFCYLLWRVVPVEGKTMKRSWSRTRPGRPSRPDLRVDGLDLGGASRSSPPRRGSWTDRVLRTWPSTPGCPVDLPRSPTD
jgi:hypothetical protein